MTIDNCESNTELRSFGRLKARKFTHRQELLVNRVLPTWHVEITQLKSSGFINAIGGRNTEVWLEIGFGGGEHLIWQASQNPQIRFIGCDPFLNGVVKILDFIECHDRDNIRLHCGDARLILRHIPPQSLSRIFVLFPDPWPKRKHNKRRLLNTTTLKLIANSMRPGAELRVATDISDYARTILIAAHEVRELLWTTFRPEDWRTRPVDWPETRYERKAINAGRICYYFCFKKNLN